MSQFLIGKVLLDYDFFNKPFKVQNVESQFLLGKVLRVPKENIEIPKPKKVSIPYR